MRGVGNKNSRSCTNILVLETITVPGRAVGAAKNVPASNSIGGRVYKLERLWGRAANLSQCDGCGGSEEADYSILYESVEEESYLSVA